MGLKGIRASCLGMSVDCRAAAPLLEDGAQGFYVKGFGLLDSSFNKDTRPRIPSFPCESWRSLGSITEAFQMDRWQNQNLSCLTSREPLKAVSPKPKCSVRILCLAEIAVLSRSGAWQGIGFRLSAFGRKPSTPKGAMRQSI